MVSVTFSITDNTKPTGAALEDVTVRVFSEDGETFVTQGTTDEDGELVLELTDETTYWVRFFKVGYQFASKLTVDVDSSESSNTFDVEGTDLLEYPPSTNEYLCRASGYVRGADWAPRAGLRMTFMLTGEPRVVADQVMVSSDLITESDDDGWIEVELVQGGTYDVIVQGMDDEVQRVQVPELQAISITHLIWPYTQTLEYGSSSVTVAVDEEEEVSATVTLSSGVTTPFTMDSGDRYSARSFLKFKVEDEDICGITWDDDDNVVIEGKKAGSTTITATVNEDAEVTRLPEPTRSIAELTVTVTE